MSDDHDGAIDAVECFQGWARSLLVVGLRIIERHVGRYAVMSACSQSIEDRLPARPVVPLAVDEAERDQEIGIAQSDTDYKRLARVTFPNTGAGQRARSAIMSR